MTVNLVVKSPNELIISVLKDLLEEAEAGEIQALAWVKMDEQNAAGCDWVDLGRCQVILGELEVLRARILNKILRKYHEDEVV